MPRWTARTRVMHCPAPGDRQGLYRNTWESRTLRGGWVVVVLLVWVVEDSTEPPTDVSLLCLRQAEGRAG